MIKSFKDEATQALWNRQASRRFQAFAGVALRKLRMLGAAASLEDLSIPPANRLEKLKGDRAGQYSIRINDRYRVCFIWKENEAHEVEIADYH
jgi:proteic killer suppression protein